MPVKCEIYPDHWELGAMYTMLLGYALLVGQEDTDWEAPETNPNWWTIRLWTRRN